MAYNYVLGNYISPSNKQHGNVKYKEKLWSVWWVLGTNFGELTTKAH